MFILRQLNTDSGVARTDVESIREVGAMSDS